MAGTNRYNPISEAVQIIAISVLIWASVQKILAKPADTVWNSLPCFHWIYVYFILV